MSDIKNDAVREAYEPPAIEDIPLRAEEQMIRGCKQAGSNNGPGAGPPFGCTLAAQCVNPGSS